MRRYADTLITVIEVFLYDPLYQWQLSPQKALQLQQQLDKMTNDTVLSGSRRSSGKVLTTTSSSPVQFNRPNESTTTGSLLLLLLYRIESKFLFFFSSF